MTDYCDIVCENVYFAGSQYFLPIVNSLVSFD